ncbi:MAG: ZIP family metal transporter [Sinobacteraceae bacterium]|nr:ZIP family metal transporter [Nevskiaceae bacterium]
MPLLGWIIVFTAIGGIASAAFAGLFLLLPERVGTWMLPHFVSFATGALIGAALLGLLPEAMEGVGPNGAHAIGAAMVVGLGVFFVIEKLVLWRHAHSQERNGQEHNHRHAHDDGRGHDHGGGHDHGHGHDLSLASNKEHKRSGASDEHGARDLGRGGVAGVLVLIGDSVHNTLDGILIAAAFLTDVPLGLVTTLAVAAHEIPHRVGDFVILLHAGFSSRRAMFLNMATGLTSVLGGIVAYFGLSKAQAALPYALAVAAAGFLYIAVAGLIPGLHRRADPRTSLVQVLLMGLGVGVVAWAESLTR